MALAIKCIAAAEKLLRWQKEIVYNKSLYSEVDLHRQGEP